MSESCKKCFRFVSMFFKARGCSNSKCFVQCSHDVNVLLYFISNVFAYAELFVESLTKLQQKKFEFGPEQNLQATNQVHVLSY